MNKAAKILFLCFLSVSENDNKNTLVLLSEIIVSCFINYKLHKCTYMKLYTGCIKKFR